MTLFVFSCVFSLIGVVYILNFIPDYKVEINAVSVVNIVLASGLSAEFVVHLIIFYLKCKSKSLEDRVRFALKNVGMSVLIGIVTTKILGVIVLSFAPSKIFQIYYFRMFFFLILLGFFHGFVLLPIFLSYINISSEENNLPKPRETKEIITS